MTPKPALPKRLPPIHRFDDLAGRSIATVEARRDLRLVPIHGPSLARLDVTAGRIPSGAVGQVGRKATAGSPLPRQQPC
jgi:hypothetical protein